MPKASGWISGQIYPTSELESSSDPRMYFLPLPVLILTSDQVRQVPLFRATQQYRYPQREGGGGGEEEGRRRRRKKRNPFLRD